MAAKQFLHYLQVCTLLQRQQQKTAAKKQWTPTNITRRSSAVLASQIANKKNKNKQHKMPNNDMELPINILDDQSASLEHTPLHKQKMQTHTTLDKKNRTRHTTPHHTTLTIFQCMHAFKETWEKILHMNCWSIQYSVDKSIADPSILSPAKGR